MNEQDPGEPATAGSNRTTYALIGALAVAAFLVGVIGVSLVRGGTDEGTVAGASSDGVETPTNVPTNSSGKGDDEEDTSGPTEEAMPTSGSAAEAPATTAGSGGGSGAQGSAPTTTAPSSEASVQVTSQPQQGAATATATAAQPTATKTPAQQATSTPTRTPTKVLPTVTKSATPTKAPPTATKSSTPTKTPTPGATMAPTTTPTVVVQQFELPVALDSTESVSDFVNASNNDRVLVTVLGLEFDPEHPEARYARVVVQVTCTGTGIQHVVVERWFPTTSFTCNRTVLDTITASSSFVGVISIEVAAGGVANVQWTASVTVLEVELP